MYLFKIHGKEYKVRFTYRAICRGDVLDKFTKATDFAGLETAKDMMNQIVTATVETLIAGLQKYHSDEFGYKDEKEYDALVERCIDMLDDYEDESTDEEPKSALTLLNDLQSELEKNGFLSAMAKSVEEAEEITQTAEAVKTEMENEPARAMVLDMKPTESES